MKTTYLPIIGALALACSLSAAQAHPRLTAAGPIPGSTIAASPKNIRIQFNEAIELAFSGVEVNGASGASATMGTAALDPANKKILVVPLTSTLAPDTYTVSWHAVGDDTHPQKGTYTFTIKP